MVRSDGLVLARKAGYEDWVRLAAATDALAIPPTSPIRSTTARKPPHRRPKVAVKRYQATGMTRPRTALQPPVIDPYRLPDHESDAANKVGNLPGALVPAPASRREGHRSVPVRVSPP